MKAKYIVSNSTNPYENLALEEYLLEAAEPDTCILYLWQNRQTVVIGRNQNAWSECKVGELEGDGGFLARRLSGGGAVFHDIGNLNFTFLMPRNRYDVDRQLSVIMEAVGSFDLTVEKSGRNDLTINGRKFSGNAFYKQNKNAYHHGTILIDVDMSALSKYLNVSPDKLKSKGVSSVVSRVSNLTEFCPQLTVEQMKNALIKAMEVFYSVPEEILNSSIDQVKVSSLCEKYSSWDWRLGRKISFDAEISERFTWGGITIQFSVESAVIKDVRVYSDAMDCDIIAEVSQRLNGCRFSSKAMSGALNHLNKSEFYERFSESSQPIISDIQNLILSQGY